MKSILLAAAALSVLAAAGGRPVLWRPYRAASAAASRTTTTITPLAAPTGATMTSGTSTARRAVGPPVGPSSVPCA